MVDGKLNGKRIRRFFQTKEEAEQDCRERNLEAEKYGAQVLPDQVRIQALAAHRMLEPLNASLIEAAELFIRSKSVAARSEKIDKIVLDFILSTQNSVEKGERSSEHLAGIKKVGKRLQAVFGSRMACDIQPHEIVRWLESLSDLAASSRDYYRRYATSIFAYAKSQGYVDVNPVHGIPSMAKKSDIGILSPEEVESLLRNCNPSMIPFYAIGFFAGLRPMSELLSLQWSNVFWDYTDRVIEVRNVKTRNHPNSPRERYVEISENLKAWLDYAGADDRVKLFSKERVVPGNWRDFVYGTQGRHRHAVNGFIQSDREKAGIKYWPHDAMRHTYASMHLAIHQSADKTADQMGHSGSRLVFEAYRRKVKKSEAEKFWSIIP